jgi:hypothetical protein
MKFALPVKCTQGHEFTVAVYADDDFPSATCPQCDSVGHVWEPLTISRSGDRMLHRSKTEMDSRDFTLSICSAVAVECFLTRAFLKWKGVENLPLIGHLPTEAEENAWEREFPRSGGFTKPADFVSNALAGMKFDDFVASNPTARTVMNQFPDAAGQSARDYFQTALFNKRNRIMHWGYLNFQETDALLCHQVSFGIIAILKAMDREKYEGMERAWRKART